MNLGKFLFDTHQRAIHQDPVFWDSPKSLLGVRRRFTDLHRSATRILIAESLQRYFNYAEPSQISVASKKVILAATRPLIQLYGRHQNLLDDIEFPN